MKELIKTILRFLFPKRYERIINQINQIKYRFAENPNEVQIAYTLLRRSISKGVMVDVGAHFGGSLRPFAIDDWEVHAFEPDRNNRKILEEACDSYENVSIDIRAVSDEIKENQPFYQSDVSSGISGLSSFHPSHKEIDQVSTITLDQYCLDHQIDSIDFLKIDTEGFDLFVLKSVPWERLKPRVIVCEFEDRKTLPLGYTYHDMARFLINHGYMVIVSEWHPIVEYGKNHKWRRFIEYPAELADVERGHGNLIAVHDRTDYQHLIKLLSRF